MRMVMTNGGGHPDTKKAGKKKGKRKARDKKR
jgi:hypothetical protein